MTLRTVRICLVIVVIGLALSGITAFPLTAEVGLVSQVLHALPDVIPAAH